MTQASADNSVTVQPDVHESTPPRRHIGAGSILRGRYLLERKLGEGGFGVIFQARDLEEERIAHYHGAQKRGHRLAIKILQPEFRQYGNVILEETRKTRGLVHENIVRVGDCQQDGDLLFMTMECLEGKTLDALLNEDFAQGMPLDRARPIIEGMGNGLAYAHDHDCVHCDLKPSNVFITSSLTPKILDFGVARAVRGQMHPSSMQLAALTPQYASADMIRAWQANGMAGYRPDPRDDVFAMACVVFELLTGRHPFAADAEHAEQARQAQLFVPAVPDLAPKQNRALTKAMAFERSERTETVRRFLKDLLPGTDARRAPRSWSRLLGAVAVTAVALGVALGIMQLRQRRSVVISAVPTKSTEPGGSQAVTHPTIATGGRTVIERSVAVLPFVDMSKNKDQEYFSDGLSEELIHRLSYSRDLRVIARTSSFQFKGRSEDVRTIAKELGVMNVLEGSVRKSGQVLRITVQLVRGSDGSPLWSQSYDRNLSDLFKVQDEIAHTVGRALEVVLLAGDDETRHRSPNIDAYNLLLQGNYYSNLDTSADNEKSIASFKHAVALDPNYAYAWARLAGSYAARSYFGSTSEIENVRKAKSAAMRALAIDPNLPEAHLALADLYAFFDWDWKAAEAQIQRARALVPDNVFPMMQLAELRVGVSAQFEDAIAREREYLSRDPLAAGGFQFLGRCLQFAGRWAESEVAFKKSVDLNPNGAGTRSFLARTYLYMGRYQEALRVAQDEPDESWRLAVLPMVYWALGRQQESTATLEEEQRKYSAVSAYLIALAYAYRGENDAAFAWFARAYRQHNAGMRWLKVDTMLENVRVDPRYHQLLLKMRLAD